MLVLKLSRWILLYLLAHIELATSQNITVLVHFGSGNTPASVVAADNVAATYAASYTNMCRSGPCSPLTIYTNIMVEGPSTAARTNIGDPSANQTFECNVISSTTGTCTYIGTFHGTVNEYTTPFDPSSYFYEPLVVTAGLDKLSSLTVLTTNGGSATTTTTAAPSSTPSTGLSPTSTLPTSALSTSTLSASCPPTNTAPTSTTTASDTISNSTTTYSVRMSPPAFTGKNNLKHHNSNKCQ
jgi:hypothetical protein